MAQNSPSSCRWIGRLEHFLPVFACFHNSVRHGNSCVSQRLSQTEEGAEFGRCCLLWPEFYLSFFFFGPLAPSRRPSCCAPGSRLSLSVSREAASPPGRLSARWVRRKVKLQHPNSTFGYRHRESEPVVEDDSGCACSLGVGKRLGRFPVVQQLIRRLSAPACLLACGTLILGLGLSH